MIVTRTEISAETAAKLVGDSVGHARRQGWEVAAAVVDPKGTLVAFLRTDGVAVPSIDFAIDKAWTAATMRRSTEAFYQRTEESPSLRVGLANRPRLMVWSGGLPLFHQGVCIGGLGVSGAKDFQDVECARAAMASAGLSETA